MKLTELNQEMKNFLNEDLRAEGQMMDTGHNWTREKIGEKEVEVLGVPLKYNILKFHIEDANEDEKDKVEFEIQDPEMIKELQNVINVKIGQAIGDVKVGGWQQIGIISQGQVLR